MITTPPGSLRLNRLRAFRFLNRTLSDSPTNLNFNFNFPASELNTLTQPEGLPPLTLNTAAVAPSQILPELAANQLPLASSPLRAELGGFQPVVQSGQGEHEELQQQEAEVLLTGIHVWNNRTFLLSWRAGLPDLAWTAAAQQCSRHEMRLLSLAAAGQDKLRHFLQLVAAEPVDSVWLGGRLDPAKQLVGWEDGQLEPVLQGQFPWSPSGLRGPQPDGLNSEDCVAILNNFHNVSEWLVYWIMINFQDGVKFHDVGCSHEKPTICEAQ